MSSLHTTEFDEQIKADSYHLNKYPEMLPFIGNCWNQSRFKTLLLGESHYIPGDELDLLYPENTFTSDWYNNLSSNLDDNHRGYIHTRGVIDIAERGKFAKPLTIFYNIKKEIKLNVEELGNNNFIFPHFAFYNYFQRPAFLEGESIINTKFDNEIAYAHLKKVVAILNVKNIIFLSKKAFDSFNDQKWLDKNDASFFQPMLVGNVPHPSSAWWNMEAKKYGGKTGRERFIELIQNISESSKSIT